VVATAKRLGEKWSFSGAFVVFYHISAIFRAFRLVVKRVFVYLQAVKVLRLSVSETEYVNGYKLIISAKRYHRSAPIGTAVALESVPKVHFGSAIEVKLLSLPKEIQNL
jgi:hypothetical protein